MLRVLHIVTNMRRGGIETMLMNYYRKIDRKRVQFDFLVHCQEEADYDAEIEMLGGKIYRVSRLIPWSRRYKILLKKFFQEHQEYKIIHVHQDCLSSVALQCAKDCGIPVRIAHSHNSSQDKNWKFYVKKYYMKKIPQYATQLFACGKEAGDWMFRGHSYRVIHNAINISDFQYSHAEREIMRRELEVENQTVLGHVGRFWEPKNHPFLIDVFAEYLKIDKNAKLLLVGGGSGFPEIKEKVRHLDIEEHVIFAGVRSDVNRLMQAMDVFVLPSLFEGLPVVLVEAQASGLPCVISDAVPKECIVTEGMVAIKRLQETPKKWAKCIWEQKNIKRRNTREEISAHGYDITEAAKELEQYYESCIEKIEGEK